MEHVFRTSDKAEYQKVLNAIRELGIRRKTFSNSAKARFVIKYYIDEIPQALREVLDDIGKPKKFSPAFKTGDRVWYISNATGNPSHGMISAILRNNDPTNPVSFLIDDDDVIHSVVRREPFIFRTQKECRAFAKRYKAAVDELLTLFLSRMPAGEGVSIAEAIPYLSDVNATVYGRLEAMKDNGKRKIPKQHLKDVYGGE